MAPLKEALYTAVWTHLQSMPKCSTLLTALNHPISGSNDIRTTWSALKSDGRDEGIKKATGLQSVLCERPDIFCFTTTDRGHQLIGLTEGAQALDPSEGVPPALPGQAFNLESTSSSTGEPFSTPTAAGEVEGLSVPSDVVPDGLPDVIFSAMAAPKQVPNQPSLSKKSGKGKGKGGGGANPNSAAYGGIWNGYIYTDIMWTPELARKKSQEKTKECQLVRALYRAMDMHSGQAVSLSQLGSDFKVAELKKDPHFKNWRLLDILKEYENVFELTPATGVTGGMAVKLQPGAEAALPDADMAAETVNEAELMLPERIEHPKTMRDRIQALRIELLYALQRRGGKTAIQELGQEPRVQKVKGEIKHQKKLIDWVKIFPENFKLTVGTSGAVDGQMVVEIGSTECYDMSMIDKTINPVVKKPDIPAAKNLGSSVGGSKDLKSRPRGRSRSRDRHMMMTAYSPSYPSSAYPPMGYPGYPSGPCPYGYGAPGQPVAGGYPGYPGYPPPGYPPPGAPPGGSAPAGAPPGYPAGYPPPGYPGAPPGYPQSAPPPGYPPAGGAQGYPPAPGAPPGYAPPAGGAPGAPQPGSGAPGYPPHAGTAPGYAPPANAPPGYPPGYAHGPPGYPPPGYGYR